MHQLLGSHRSFDIYTNRSILAVLFNLTSAIAKLSKTAFQKVLRYTVRPSVYSYSCVHVLRTNIVSSDAIRPWAAPRVLRRLLSLPVFPLLWQRSLTDLLPRISPPFNNPSLPSVLKVYVPTTTIFTTT